jgi:hypothetical protein
MRVGYLTTLMPISLELARYSAGNYTHVSVYELVSVQGYEDLWARRCMPHVSGCEVASAVCLLTTDDLDRYALAVLFQCVS